MERFWNKVSKAGPDECWEWQSAVGGTYGQFWLDGRPQQAHRVALALVGGEVPEGYDLHHKCNNRLCVNPAHLEPLSRRDHQHITPGISGVNAAKQHCPRGHQYSCRNSQGRRICRTCINERERARRRKAAA